MFQLWILLLLLLHILPPGIVARMRYRSGLLLDPANSASSSSNPALLIETRQDLSVHQARLHCQSLDPICVAFAFASPGTQFPAGPITASFYRVADWHVSDITHQPVLVSEEGWHLYVNVTRETGVENRLAKKKLVKVLSYLNNQKRKSQGNDITPSDASSTKSTKLRGGNGSGIIASSTSEINDISTTEEQDLNQRLIWLGALFNIAMLHPLASAPLLAQPCVQWATASHEADAVRQSALHILIALADTADTASLLVPVVYEPMKQLIIQSGSASPSNDVLSKSALDVLSNIIIHRSEQANTLLMKLGVQDLLESLLELPPTDDNKPNFQSVQAAMALSHLHVQNNDDESVSSIHLPQASLETLVSLLDTALDGDIDYDIQWELVPGPLSAIFHIVSPINLPILLDAGLLERLGRILDESHHAVELSVCLQLLTKLHHTADPRAQTMLLWSEHAIQQAAERLAEYQTAYGTAQELLQTLRSGQRSKAEL